MKLAVCIVALLFVPVAAHADYVVKDGSGQSIVIRSMPISPGQMPQSIPTDATGTPYSINNPLPSKQPTGNGTDAGANAPSLSGLTLLGTMSANAARAGFEVGCNCAAGMDIVLDDQGGSITQTIIPIAGPTVDGQQGGGYSNSFHSGRVRFYSSNSSCQYWARQWP